MQIRMRCFKCQTLFVVKIDEIKAALEVVHAENLKHYNAHCPKCGRANKVSNNQLKKAVPNWKPADSPVSED
jgi:DNA-directed RNA polymerase subunit M/transcription elongation factor TFIIS